MNYEFYLATWHTKSGVCLGKYIYRIPEIIWFPPQMWEPTEAQWKNSAYNREELLKTVSPITPAEAYRLYPAAFLEHVR